MNEELELLRDKKGFICDMDGVIYHGNRLLPGVPEFVDTHGENIEAGDYHFVQIDGRSSSPARSRTHLRMLSVRPVWLVRCTRRAS